MKNQYTKGFLTGVAVAFIATAIALLPYLKEIQKEKVIQSYIDKNYIEDVDKTEISSNAMELFQRDLDINKFTKIATSDKDNISYLEKMQELFKNGVVDPFEDDVLKVLVTNSKLLGDLEL